MGKIKEINIKSENQTVSLAIGEFLIELDRCKYNKTKLMKVITGYGSHGKGGEIKRELVKELFSLKRKGEIKNYIPCDQLSQEYLHNLCLENPDLILDNELSNCNSGVILVEIE